MKRLQKNFFGNRIIHRYFSDIWFKTSVSLRVSFVFNLLYAIYEIICGVYYESPWFITLGCYYILLMLARLVLLYETKNQAKDKTAEWKRYRICGILLLFMNLVLAGIVVLAVNNDYGSRYAGYLIYAIAAYTFYKVVMAIRNFVKYRNICNSVIVISRVISFVSAIISILSLEIAMILQFGDDEIFFRVMTVITGAGVCIIISAVAIYMIVTAHKDKSR